MQCAGHTAARTGGAAAASATSLRNSSLWNASLRCCSGRPLDCVLKSLESPGCVLLLSCLRCWLLSPSFFVLSHPPWSLLLLLQELLLPSVTRRTPISRSPV